MLQKKYIIDNNTGLHARPASQLTELANTFESDIMLITTDDEVDAKSIIDILSAGIDKGTEVTLSVEGEDEKDAFAALDQYLSNLID